MIEHAIPQNIMDYEFKLFAGLSLKQFIYVAVSGGFSFLLFMLNKSDLFPTFFAWLTIPVILLTGIILGLGSYRGRTMEDWLTSFARSTKIPLRRVWMKEKTIVKYDNFFTTKPELFPNYLASYFYSQEEFRKIMQKTFGKDVYIAQQSQSNVVQTNSAVNINTSISLTSSNAMDFAEPGVVLPSIPNTVAFRVIEDNIPMEGVTAYIKDKMGTVITALRSNKEGIIYFNHSFDNGEYSIDMQATDEVVYPAINIVFDGTTYPLINITPSS